MSNKALYFLLDSIAGLESWFLNRRRFLTLSVLACIVNKNYCGGNILRSYTFLIITAVALSGCTSGIFNDTQKPRRLVHDVYFELNDDSENARTKLIDDCYKYLSNHPGVVFFAAGELVDSHNRDVNVRDWHVSLHIVFKNKGFHDRYQNAPDHHKFIELNRDNWQRVRVFDSYTK